MRPSRSEGQLDGRPRAGNLGEEDPLVTALKKEHPERVDPRLIREIGRALGYAVAPEEIKVKDDKK